ncbi:MAG: DPP IV N-terminal domain-containing protein [Gammaproteobacteria bacterium]|nr:DPP IV N-terminal domain-containing protein [Gammaproteobacteria bacterium]
MNALRTSPFSAITLLGAMCIGLSGCATDILYERSGSIYKLRCDAEIPLSVASTDNTFPRWSPDGRQFAYIGQQFGRKDIFVRSGRIGASATNLTGSNVAEPLADFEWSPDGDWILYTAINSTGTTSIYRVRTDAGSRPEPVSPFSLTSRQPSWSPDGRRFVYSSDSPSAEREFGLYTANANGTNRTLLVDLPNVNESKPSWGASGSIAYVRRGGDLVIRFSDGSEHTHGYIEDSLLLKPAWSNDGEWIAYPRTQGINRVMGRPPHTWRVIVPDTASGLEDFQARWYGSDASLVYHRRIITSRPDDTSREVRRIKADGNDDEFLAYGQWPDPRPRLLSFCL